MPRCPLECVCVGIDLLARGTGFSGRTITSMPTCTATTIFTVVLQLNSFRTYHTHEQPRNAQEDVHDSPHEAQPQNTLRTHL